MAIAVSSYATEFTGGNIGGSVQLSSGTAPEAVLWFASSGFSQFTAFPNLFPQVGQLASFDAVNGLNFAGTLQGGGAFAGVVGVGVSAIQCMANREVEIRDINSSGDGIAVDKHSAAAWRFNSLTGACTALSTNIPVHGTATDLDPKTITDAGGNILGDITDANGQNWAVIWRANGTVIDVSSAGGIPGVSSIGGHNTLSPPIFQNGAWYYYISAAIINGQPVGYLWQGIN